MKKNKFRSGFTLIEILVVMVIIGILATIGMGSFQSSQMKARDASRKNDLVQVGKALEIYYNDHGSYPVGTGGEIIGCNGTACTWGETFIDEKGTVYMVELPADPKGNYEYYYESDGSYFQLYARLENDRDIDLYKNPSGETQAFVGLDCGEKNCNYGVASTNTTAEEGRNYTAN
jgi:general secretion pathway protein G